MQDKIDDSENDRTHCFASQFKLNGKIKLFNVNFNKIDSGVVNPVSGILNQTVVPW